MDLRIAEADLRDARQAEALVAILDAYAREPGGQSAPLADGVRARIVPGLLAQASTSVLLAWVDGRPVGAAVLIWGFSTFAGREMVNVHDLAVLPEFRGRGAGRALLAEVERRARERDCCKITLEVHDANAGAKRLYQSLGFGSFESPTWFVTRRL